MNTGWDSHSEEIADIAKAFVAAAGQLTDIKRERTANAGTYSYKYADLGDALSSVRPLLAKEGLAVTQSVTITDRDVKVWTTVLHESGQWFTTHPVVLPAGNTAQMAGSAITYCRRYSLMAALGLATEDDDGALAGTRDAAPARKPAVNKPTGKPPPVIEFIGFDDLEAITATFAAITDTEIRTVMKAAFLKEFGKPTEIHSDRVAEVMKWLVDYTPGEPHDEP